MNTPLETAAHEAETVDIRHDDVWVVSKAIGTAPNQGSPVPLWLQARVRTIGFRHADLVQTHWRKVCRSVVED